MSEIAVRDTGVSREPGSAELANSESPTDAPPNPLDSEEALREHRQMCEWWCESRDLTAENRAEMVLDHEYYDNHQFSPEEKAILAARGQAAIVYNKAALTIDWLTGTERRTRVDYAVHPRNEDGLEDAKNKEKLLKYLSDVNRTGWERSRAFKDAAIGGIGWLEQSIRGDSTDEMLLDGYVPWQQMWYDPFSRDYAFKDCRYVTRRKWLDLDFGMSLFPDRADIIRRASRSHLYADEDLLDDEMDLPQPFRRYDTNGVEVVQRRWSSPFPSDGGTTRLRVPIAETYWRQPRRIKRLWGLEFPGVEFDPNNNDHAQAHDSGYYSLTDAVTSDIRVSIWVPLGLLYSGVSPFKHKQFPFTPVWGKRRSNDGMPYGTMRGIRDAQDDLNHTHSKIKWMLSSAQVIREKTAVDDEDAAEMRRNVAKPNGEIVVNDGVLAQGRFRIETHIEKAKTLTEFAADATAHIHDGSGVNREQLGRDTNATSGRAIRAKQEEGGVSTAELFDNLRLAVQLCGEKDLANIEQYMTLPMQVYISGEGKRGGDWMRLNQVEQMPDGSWNVRNDVTKQQCKFIVDQQDYRESIRQAQAEQFWDMLGSLPPDVIMSLLDLAVESTDLPQKDEIVKRIRKLNNQPDPDTENDPAAQAQRQQQDAAQQQAEQEQRQLEMRAALAKVGFDEARTSEINAKTKGLNLKSKQQAMDIAQLLRDLLPLAPAADRVFEGTQPEDVPSVPQPAGQ
jgi:hypothetical protein